MPLSAQKYKKLNDKGLASYNAHDYDAAIQWFSKSIDKQDEQAEAYYYRGMTYFTLKRYRDAISDFDHSIRVSPDFEYPYLYKGICKIILSSYQEALNDLETQLRLKPGTKKVLKYRGIAKFKLGQYEEAIADINAGVDPIIDDMEALGFRALCYVNLGKVKEADQDVNAGMAIDSSDYNILLGKSWLCLYKDQIGGSLWYIQKAYAIQHLDKDYYSLLIRLYFKTVDYDRLESACLQYNRIEDNYLSYYALGMVHIRRNNYDSAYKYLRKSYDLNPTDFYTLSSVFRLALDRKYYEESNRYANELIKNYPDSSFGYVAKGYMEFNSGNNESGYRNFKTAFVKDSSNVENVVIYISCLYDENDSAKARFYVKKLMGNLRDTINLNKLLENEMRYKDYGYAIEICDKLYAINPKDVSSLEKKAWCYFMMEDNDAALKCVKTINDKDPGNAEADILKTMIALNSSYDENEVISKLEDLIKRYPTHGSPYVMLAIIKYSAGIENYCDDYKKSKNLKTYIFFRSLDEMCSR